MFDIGASELLVIVIIAIIVIGPKELPLALRTAGRWIAKVRRVSSHFRTGLDAMIREAEMEDMDRKWKEQNEAIKRKYPAAGPASADEDTTADGHGDEMMPLEPPPANAPAISGSAESREGIPPHESASDEPPLPFDSAKGGG